jgi:hypothetical protein
VASARGAELVSGLVVVQPTMAMLPAASAVAITTVRKENSRMDQPTFRLYVWNRLLPDLRPSPVLADLLTGGMAAEIRLGSMLDRFAGLVL